MGEIFRYRQGWSAVWHNRKVERSNQYCPYCARFIGVGSTILSNKEHLIGRNFVPSDLLGTHNAFNFIFRACVDCNGEKASVEGHVSTISLLLSSGRIADTSIDELARRKAKNDYHPSQPGTRVAEVVNQTTLQFGSTMSVTLVGPPQLNPDFVHLLALRHVQGFYALTTSSDPTVAESTLLLPAAHFGLFAYYPRSDWGNPQLIEIADRVTGWPAVVQVSTANGYFRAVLRKGPTADSPWFWALEWNKGVRVVGWIGDPRSPPALFQSLPQLEWHQQATSECLSLRTRLETPLSAAGDTLFHFD